MEKLNRFCPLKSHVATVNEQQSITVKKQLVADTGAVINTSAISDNIFGVAILPQGIQTAGHTPARSTIETGTPLTSYVLCIRFVFLKMTF